MGSNKGSNNGAPNAGSTFSNTSSSLANASNSTSAGAQITSAAPQALASYNRLLGMSDFIFQQTPYTWDMDQKVAGLNPQQNQSIDSLVAQGLDAGNFDPTKVQAIESPYTDDVVNATQNWFNNQNSIQGDNLLGNAIKSGNAFGGDRAGVSEAQLGGQQQLAQAPVIAGLQQAGYTQALQEYNTLKQLGLTGGQQALQASTVRQTQAQREFDASRQNAIQRAAYLPELMNWYASLVGNLGPLEGSESVATGSTESAGSATNIGAGNTTPPSPNSLTAGLGLASSAIGLGRSFFGKRGGLVRLAGGGGVSGGSGGDNGQPNILSDVGTAVMSTGPFGSPRISRAGANMPSAKTMAAQSLPTPQAQPQPTPQPTASSNSSSSDNSFLGGLGNVLSFGAKVAPLFLLHRGGLVPGLAGGGPIRLKRRYDNGGDVDFDFGGDGSVMPPPVEESVFNGYDPERKDRYLPDENMSANGMTDRTDDDTADDATLIPVHAGLVQGDEPASGSPAGMPGDMVRGLDSSSGSPAGLPELSDTGAGGPSDPDQPKLAGGLTDTSDVIPAASSTRVPGLAPTDMSAQSRRATVGDGGPRQAAASTRQIPGLGKPPSTFASRAASDPFLAAGIAMLKNRSPYFGPGLGAGLEGAQGALATTAKQEQLDAKPQMITNGETVQFRIGDKMIDTGIRTETAAQKAADRRARELQKERLGIQADEKEKDRQARAELAADKAERSGKDKRDMIDARAKKLMEADPSMTYPDALARAQAAHKGEDLAWEKEAAKRAKEDPDQQGLDYWRKFYGLPPKASGPGGRRSPEPAPAPSPSPPSNTAPVTPGTKPPGVPEVKAPAAPDLKGALAAGKITPAEVIEQAKGAIARAPSQRDAIIKRLEDAKIDTTSLKLAPAIPMVPISQ